MRLDGTADGIGERGFAEALQKQGLTGVALAEAACGETSDSFGNVHIVDAPTGVRNRLAQRLFGGEGHGVTFQSRLASNSK